MQELERAHHRLMAGVKATLDGRMAHREMSEAAIAIRDAVAALTPASSNNEPLIKLEAEQAEIDARLERARQRFLETEADVLSKTGRETLLRAARRMR